LQGLRCLAGDGFDGQGAFISFGGVFFLGLASTLSVRKFRAMQREKAMSQAKPKRSDYDLWGIRETRATAGATDAVGFGRGTDLP
jgi:hypothetical protein